MSLPPFEEVVALHSTTVLRVCRAVLGGGGGAADAEDAAADALLAALEAYPSLRPDSDVRAWLVTVAHRKALDVARRSARRPRRPLEEPGPATGADQGVGSDGALWAALRALPDKQRAAVTLRHVGDLAYAEVASAMGVSEAAARRSAADGLRALRASYRRTDDEEEMA